MSTKLDTPLDDIVKSNRRASRRNTRVGRRAAPGRSKTATANPVGGVSKAAKAGRAAAKAAVPAIPIPATGESKIIVSGLPADVTDTQIKDYFSKTIGPVKRVFLTYGPNGQSKGIATIAFAKPGSAADAAAQLNGVKVDNRAMKIEVILSAAQAPAPIAPKALGERIAQQKSAAKAQPKPATASKNAKATVTSAGRRGGRGRRPNNRGKPKTAAELDAEMTDYFDTNTATNGANGVAAAANASGGDTGMEDQIL